MNEKFTNISQCRTSRNIVHYGGDGFKVEHINRMDASSPSRKIILGLACLFFPWHFRILQTHETHETHQKHCREVGLIWVELCGLFACSQDCVRVGRLCVAVQRSKLHAFFVDAHNVEPENGTSSKTEVGRRPFDSFVPRCVVFRRMPPLAAMVCTMLVAAFCAVCHPPKGLLPTGAIRETTCLALPFSPVVQKILQHFKTNCERRK